MRRTDRNSLSPSWRNKPPSSWGCHNCVANSCSVSGRNRMGNFARRLSSFTNSGQNRIVSSRKKPKGVVEWIGTSPPKLASMRSLRAMRFSPLAARTRIAGALCRVCRGLGIRWRRFSWGKTVRSTHISSSSTRRVVLPLRVAPVIQIDSKGTGKLRWRIENRVEGKSLSVILSSVSVLVYYGQDSGSIVSLNQKY